ncbi:delta-9 desaturase [Ectocarpus siliculosus]|uniref:Delta-9 desaturase n=1 Tax=Ectocarpus siliculosus TaxID=2880 RepID=D8LB74_ECTSI|nr:delta-9 desaturase [Ectocarpus siliculosus]|eukprot:CBN76583.1 delta-9 desaturase [Ectocarpus siliculosus]
MVGAIVLQIGTGFARVRALEAKSNNFSLFHRVNKHFHISAGWFAYAAGLVQCYRGLELVSGSDKLIFSAVDINFTFFTKGAARLCCFVELVNEKFTDEAIQQEVDNRLMPRTEELPIYTMQEFNDKVLNGRSWVIVDGAVLNVSDFAKRHPGGIRLIINAMGTDVTSEFLGENASVGNPGTVYKPHRHTDTALEIARSLVVGYIEEEDDMEETYTSEAEAEGGGSRGGGGFGGGGRSGSGDGYASDYRRKASLSSSGAASDGSSAEAGAPATLPTCRNSRSNARRSFFSSTTTTPRGYSGSYRASTPAREQTASLGRPAPFLDSDDTGKSNDSDDSYSGRGGSSGGVDGGGGGGGERLSVRGRARNKSCSGSDESGSDGGEKMRGRSSLGRRVSVGIPKISRSKTAELPSGGAGEPSATVAAGSAVRLSAEASAILNARSPPEVWSDSSARTGRRTAAPGAAATAEGASLTLPPHPAPTLKRFATAPISTVGGEGWQGKPKELLCPLASDRAVSPRWMEPALPEKPAVVIKAAGARMLKRLGSQIEFFGASVDESDSKQVPCGVKYRKTEVVVGNVGYSLGWFDRGWPSTPLDWSVPIAAGRDRMPPSVISAPSSVQSPSPTCGGGARVFRRNTTVRPCMEDSTLRIPRRVARTRNPLHSFHVCPLLLHEKLCDGGGRPVHKFVFACPGTAAALVGSMEGVCHFNMRLAQEAGMRLPRYRQKPVYVARQTVVQRAYNAFAVRVLDEEGKRRVVPSLESSEGVLCVEMRIRLYPDGLMSGLLAHLIKAKANGLLEVTALISGDHTRRNIPGNTFRRAKARLMKKGAAAGLVPRGEREVDSDTGDAKNDDDDALPANLPRLWSVSELSRVSEEDSSHTGGSKSTRSLGVFDSTGSRDLETGGGGGGGGGDLGLENTIGEAERADVDVPWSASDTAADTKSKAGKHRQHGNGGGGGGGSGGSAISSSGAAKNPRSTSFAGGAHIWSEEEAGQGQKSRSDNDGVPRGTLIAGRRGSGGGRLVDTEWGSTRRKSAARKSTSGPRGSSGDGLGGDSARSGIRVADSIQAAGLDRGRWSKKKARGSKLKIYSYPDGDDDDDGGGGSGGGRIKPTAPRFHSSYRSKIGTRDGVADDSSGNGQGRPPKTVGARRKGRRWASRDRSAMRAAGQPGGSPLDDEG